MPIYEYACPECDAKFESMRPVSRMDEPAECPTCGGAGERQLSAFAFKDGRYGGFFKAGKPMAQPGSDKPDAP